MQIEKMLLAAQAAVNNEEIPTVEQILVMSAALHSMTVRMDEFLWFSESFRHMGDVVYAAGQSAVSQTHN